MAFQSPLPARQVAAVSSAPFDASKSDASDASGTTSQDDTAPQNSAQQLPVSVPQQAAQLLSSGAGAIALRYDTHEFNDLLFQAMWTEDDSNSSSGQKRVVNLIITQGSTKQRMTQTKVTRDKLGNAIERTELKVKPIAQAPIVPLALVKIINSTGAVGGNKYLVRIRDREVYLPFGVANKTVRELQEILEKNHSVAMDEHETSRLAKALAIVCDQDKIRQGNTYRREFEILNPDLSFKTAMADGKAKFIRPNMSSEGAVFIDDQDSAATAFGAPSVSYAYSESGWSPRMVQDPETGEWSQNGLIHVLEGDPLFAGSAFYKSGGGGIVHKNEDATEAGWLAAFRRFSSRSPLIGAITAQAMGALGRGLLETSIDVSGILYLNGATGRGKSTATRVAASIMGYPRLQDTSHPSPLINANQTGVSFDRVAQSIRHGFMAIDEIQQNQGSSIAEFIMRLANGMGRGRSQLAGSVNQDQIGWDLTVLINGNDEMSQLLETGKREQGGAKFLEAIQARLLDINITQNPVFPTDLPGNEDVASTKIENDAAMVELDRHHGVFYNRIVQWLSDNRDRATTIFNEAEQNYLRRFTTEDYEQHLQRSSKNAGYEAVGFAIMKEVLGMEDEEIAVFSDCWDRIIETNANLMRKEEVDVDTTGDLHDLISQVDRMNMLSVDGYFAQHDSDSPGQQQTNARTRDINTHDRFPNGWIIHLEQPKPMTATDAYEGIMYIVPSGAGVLADPVMRDLRTMIEATIKKCSVRGMVIKPKTGRGEAQSKSLGGKKARVVMIKLTKAPPPPPTPQTPEEIAGGDDVEAQWEAAG